MKCPVCKDVTLLMSEKRGIEIDYCPECRGIWLDRGELEKLMEKEEKTYQETRNEYTAKEEERNNKGEHSSKGRKKESFLSEIFEIFGH